MLDIFISGAGISEHVAVANVQKRDCRSKRRPTSKVKRGMRIHRVKIDRIVMIETQRCSPNALDEKGWAEFRNGM